MKKLTIITLFLVTCTLLGAQKNIFVDNSYTGEPENGTLEQPYKSIQTAVNSAEMGDAIYVMKGVYREAVVIDVPGISLQPFGDDTVQLNGCEHLFDWQAVGNGVYKAIMDWDLDYIDYTNQLFIDGEMMHVARWPKNTSEDFLMEPTASLLDDIYKEGDFVKLVDNEFDEPATRWIGAQVYVNPTSTIYRLDGSAWSEFVYEIDGNILSTKGLKIGREDSDWGAEEGSEFYLYNPTPQGVYNTGGVKELLSNGEWWKNGDTVFIKTFDGSAPASNAGESNLVEAKKYPFVFAPVPDEPMKNITITGFHLFATSITTEHDFNQRTTLSEAVNVKIDQIEARYIMHTMDFDGDFQWQWCSNSGIILAGTGCELTNSTIKYSAASAVSVFGRKNKVLNNKMLYCNYMGTEASVINCGTRNAISEDHQIGYNDIFHTAHAAISYMELINSDINKPGMARIHHNHIYNSMTRHFDLGAIKGAGQYGQWIRIDHNVIHNEKLYEYGQARSGLYFDFGSDQNNNQSLFIVDHNLVYNVERGITINHLNGMKVYNNTLFAPEYNERFAGFSFYGVDNLGHDLEIKNNIHSGFVGNDGDAVVEANYTPVGGEWITYFSDTSAGDFTLKADAVNLIDKGVDVSPWNDSIIDDPDIGAYEWGTKGWKAGAEIPVSQVSYIGVPHTLPGIIQTEDYDIGGPGVAFADSTLENENAKYRNESVDIDTTFDVNGGYMVTGIKEGEWLEYSVEIPNSGIYTIEARVASPHGGIMEIFIGDSTSGELVFPSTGDWSTWTNISATGINLGHGKYVMRVNFKSDSLNLNYLNISAESIVPLYKLELADRNGQVHVEPPGLFYDEGTVVTLMATPEGGFGFLNWSGDAAGTNDSISIVMDTNKLIEANFFVQPQSPYGGTPWPVPGLIETELYDQGGFNVAYYDNSPGTESSSYRPSFRNDSVDISIASATGGCSDFLIGWQAKGEWKEYTINVAKTDTYNFDVSYAADDNFGGSMEVIFEKNNESTGTMEIPPTGGWNTCHIATVEGIMLEEGEQIMKVNPLSDGHNIDYVYIYDPENIPEFNIQTGVEPAEGGAVSMNPENGPYIYQSDIVLTATPAEGYQFDSWSGDKSYNVNSLPVNMIKNLNITANFTKKQYMLTTSVIPTGTGTISREPDKTSYYHGEEVLLEAIPDEGFVFSHWRGDVSDSVPEIMVTMDKINTISAVFLSAVDINTLSNKDKILIKPNPVTNILYLNNSGPFYFDIINILGKSVKQGKITEHEMNSASINVTELEHGLYFLKITREDTYQMVKFIKH